MPPSTVAPTAPKLKPPPPPLPLPLLVLLLLLLLVRPVVVLPDTVFFFGRGREVVEEEDELEEAAGLLEAAEADFGDGAAVGSAGDGDVSAEDEPDALVSRPCRFFARRSRRAAARASLDFSSAVCRQQFVCRGVAWGWGKAKPSFP